ncbi:MAG TPA: RsmE family RNA methyltransferase [Gemmataceae bacterium]|nr:RsmE family RNA methyltransferase [Gemmataceae bacterium]
MAERFYVNCPLALGPVEVEGAEAHHLAAVCRLRPGDAVSLFNGDGREYRAEVRAIARRKVVLEVLAVETASRELGFPLEVAAPLPKGDRGQFLVEKLTELGATSFVPLRTRRSVVHPGETRLQKMERWVIEASKQCGRNVLMQVRPLIGWDEYCRRGNLPGIKVVAHSGQSEERDRQGKGQSIPSSIIMAAQENGLAVAVGPEGGFTEEEIEMARAAEWRVVHLGPRILRVETAALVLAAWAAGLSGQDRNPDLRHQ